MYHLSTGVHTQIAGMLSQFPGWGCSQTQAAPHPGKQPAERQDPCMLISLWLNKSWITFAEWNNWYFEVNDQSGDLRDTIRLWAGGRGKLWGLPGTEEPDLLCAVSRSGPRVEILRGHRCASYPPLPTLGSSVLQPYIRLYVSTFPTMHCRQSVWMPLIYHPLFHK